MVVAGRFWVETLGCPKNEVDSDKVPASLARRRAHPGADAPDDADLVVVNTCAFVADARRESIETILALAARRRPGAPPRRHRLPRRALRRRARRRAPRGRRRRRVRRRGRPRRSVAGRRRRRRRPAACRDLLELPRPRGCAPWAYVKVAEGLRPGLRFCAIPSFRGTQRSRHPDAIVAECAGLVAGGAAELVLVAQDVAWYGRDTRAARRARPARAPPRPRARAARVRRLRLLYLYPSEVARRAPRHASSSSTRPSRTSTSRSSTPTPRCCAAWPVGDGDRFLALLDTIRARRPDAAFRSSFIVGYPGETEADHDTLLDFLAAAQLDWAGFFAVLARGGDTRRHDGRRRPRPGRQEWLAECEDLQGPHHRRAGATPSSVPSSRCSSTDATATPARWGRTHREAPEIDGRRRASPRAPRRPAGPSAPRPSRRSASTWSPSPSRRSRDRRGRPRPAERARALRRHGDRHAGQRRHVQPAPVRDRPS